MFLTQVLVPVLIVAGVCIWAGMRFEREKHIVQMKAKPVEVRLPKNYDWRA
jgi:hypothetical protein